MRKGLSWHCAFSTICVEVNFVCDCFPHSIQCHWCCDADALACCIRNSSICTCCPTSKGVAIASKGICLNCLRYTMRKGLERHCAFSSICVKVNFVCVCFPYSIECHWCRNTNALTGCISNSSICSCCPTSKGVAFASKGICLNCLCYTMCKGLSWHCAFTTICVKVNCVCICFPHSIQCHWCCDTNALTGCIRNRSICTCCPTSKGASFASKGICLNCLRYTMRKGLGRHCAFSAIWFEGNCICFCFPYSIECHWCCDADAFTCCIRNSSICTCCPTCKGIAFASKGICLNCLRYTMCKGLGRHCAFSSICVKVNCVCICFPHSIQCHWCCDTNALTGCIRNRSICTCCPTSKGASFASKGICLNRLCYTMCKGLGRHCAFSSICVKVNFVCVCFPNCIQCHWCRNTNALACCISDSSICTCCPACKGVAFASKGICLNCLRYTMCKGLGRHCAFSSICVKVNFVCVCFPNCIQCHWRCYTDAFTCCIGNSTIRTCCPTSKGVSFASKGICRQCLLYSMRKGLRRHCAFSTICVECNFVCLSYIYPCGSCDTESITVKPDIRVVAVTIR